MSSVISLWGMTCLWIPNLTLLNFFLGGEGHLSFTVFNNYRKSPINEHFKLDLVYKEKMEQKKFRLFLDKGVMGGDAMPALLTKKK